MSSPDLRLADPTDAAAIADLCGELGYTATVAEVTERLQRLATSPNDRCWVAESDGVVVGWLQAHVAEILESGLRLEIAGLVVSKKARRSGVGRMLVVEAERWATTLDASAVVVRSNVAREESHRFYPALGYVRTKTQHVYVKRLRPSSAELAESLQSSSTP